MSDHLDLTLARSAARKMCRDNMPVDFIGDKRMEQWVDLMAHYAVTAAAPLIEAAAREQVAQEIEAERERQRKGGYLVSGGAYIQAARIARGGAS